MKKQRKASPVIIGGSSLLVIFAVLCLTVFALLCLSSVQASSRLSSTAADAVKAYYEADTKAEEILAKIRTEGNAPEAELADGIYTYTVPISDTQELYVRIKTIEDSGNNPENQQYEVLTWKAENTADWETNTMITLWSGE